MNELEKRILDLEYGWVRIEKQVDKLTQKA